MGFFEFVPQKSRQSDDSLDDSLEDAAEATAEVVPPAQAELNAAGEDVPPADTYRINVHIIECRQLLALDDSGTSDPKVKIILNGECRQTRTIDKNNHPYFDESMTFDFEVENQYALAACKLRVEVWDDNSLSPNDLIGSFDLGLGDVWNHRDHEYFRQWFGLSDPSGSGSAVRGYLCGSVSILGSTDKIIVRTDAVYDSAIKNVIVPSNVQMVPWRIDLSVLEARDLPQMDKSDGDPDPYVVFEYSGTRVRTNKASDKTNPQFDEMVSIPAMLPADLDTAAAIQYLCWNQVEVGVYDSDKGADDLIATQSVDKWLSAHLRQNDDAHQSMTTGYQWLNLYGAPKGTPPEKTVSGLFGSTETPAKQMNAGKVEGSAYRGRLLIKLDAHRNSEPEKKQKGDQLLERQSHDLLPAEQNHELRLWILEGSVSSADDTELRVQISCGDVTADSRASKVQHGHCVWYQEIAVELSGFPKDMRCPQTPDIFVGLYREQERLSYIRIPKAQGGTGGLKEISQMMTTSGLPDASWYSMKRDVFGPLGRTDFAGDLLMVVGFSDAASAPERLPPQMQSAPAVEQPIIPTQTRVQMSLITKRIEGLSKHPDSKGFFRMDPYVRYSFYTRAVGTRADSPLTPLECRATGYYDQSPGTTAILQKGGSEPEWERAVDGGVAFDFMLEEGKEIWVAIDVMECEDQMVPDNNDLTLGTRFLKLNSLFNSSGSTKNKRLKIYTPVDHFAYNPGSTTHKNRTRKLSYEHDWKGEPYRQGKVSLTVSAGLYEVPKTGGGTLSIRSTATVVSALQQPKLYEYALRVHVYQGKDLPPADTNGSANPYLAITVGQHAVLKTSAKTQTLHPRWHETLEWKSVMLPGLARLKQGLGPQLIVQLFDRDIACDDYLGRFSVTLRAASVTGTAPLWYDVMYLDSNDSVGELLLSMQLIPVDEQPNVAGFFPRGLDDPRFQSLPAHWARPKMRDCTIELFVHGCRGLQPHYYLPAACPYVTAGIGTSGNLPKKSTVLSGTPEPANPNFDEILSIRTELPQDPMFAPTLTVEVFDSRFGGVYKPLLGSCEIEIGEHLPWRRGEVQQARRQAQAGGGGLQLLLAELEPMDNTRLSAPAGFATFENELARHNSGQLVGSPMRGSNAVGNSGGNRFTYVEPWKIGRLSTTEQLEHLLKKANSTTFHSWELQRYSEFGADSGGPSMQRTKVSGVLKGFIRITEHLAAPVHAPLEWPIKLSELTIPQFVTVRLYVLEATGLRDSDTLSKPDPYLKVTLGKEEQSTKSRYVPDSCDPYFGEVFEFDSQMPGDTKLQIDVIDTDMFGSDLIGSTVIDLEERFFNADWRMLGTQLTPSVNQLIKRPVEQRPLLLPGKASQGTLVCWCDIFDKDQAKHNPPVNIAKPPPVEFELRVVIWKANNLKIMDSSGLSDVQFTVTLSGHNPENNELVEETLETDTHWRATGGNACFNWRLVFKLMLPMKPRARLTIKAWDRDPLEFTSELIGRWDYDLNEEKGSYPSILDEAELKYRSHVHFIKRVESMSTVEQVKAELRRVADHEERDGQGLDDLKDTLLTMGSVGLTGTATRFPRGGGGGAGFSAGALHGKNKLTLTADQSRQRNEEGRSIGDGESWQCRLMHPNGEERGTVEIQFELLPKALAELRPAGQGRDEPNQLPKLSQPLRETFSWKHPAQLMRTLLGPVYYNQFKAASTFMLLLTICLLIGPNIVSKLVVDEAEKIISMDKPVEITNADEFVAPGGGGGGKG